MSTIVDAMMASGPSEYFDSHASALEKSGESAADLNAPKAVVSFPCSCLFGLFFDSRAQ